jgi:hypothetical protein
MNRQGAFSERTAKTYIVHGGQGEENSAFDFVC